MIDNKKAMKKKLRSIEKIDYSKHFEKDRLPYRRNITKNLIEKHIKNPEDLVNFEYQEDTYKRDKYALLFDKSRKYDLKIIISVKGKYLNVITAHIQNKKKREKFKQGFR